MSGTMIDPGIVGLESWDAVQKYHDRKLAEKNELITELCDALDAFGNGIVTMGWAKAGDIEPLIQRAREATR
jgi:hypothetical protein